MQGNSGEKNHITPITDLKQEVIIPVSGDEVSDTGRRRCSVNNKESSRTELTRSSWPVPALV